MSYCKETLYCGPSNPGLCSIFGIGKKDAVNAWFNSKGIYFTHKARVAIRRACSILGIGEGDEILAPAYNCGTEIDALMSSKASIVLYRTDKVGGIDFGDLQQRVTKKTKLIYITHYFGFPQPLSEISNLCNEKQISLLEDCALSLFSNDGTTRIGSVGDIAVFNFPKSLPVPDGGVLVVNNRELLPNRWERRNPSVVKVMRNMLPLLKRYILHMSSGSKVLYPVAWSLLGRHQREVNEDKQAAGAHPDMPEDFYYDENLNNRGLSRITQLMLRTFDVTEVVERRRHNFGKYLEHLSGADGVEPLYRELPKGVCPLYFPVIVKNRRSVCERLKAASIEAIEWWAGYHRSLPWDDYPDACFLKDNLLVLPVHQNLDERHVLFIVKRLYEALQDVSGGI